MKTKIIALGVAVALAGGGAYGYKAHQRTALLESISPSVKNASIRVNNSAKLETDKSNITFKEFFERLDNDISEIEKRSIDIQSLSNKDNEAVTAPVVAYMHDCEEFSRALSMKYRKNLAFSNASDRFTDALGDMRTATDTYGLQFAKQRSDKAIDEMKKAGSESDEAALALIAATKHLRDSRSKLATLVSDDSLVPTVQLDAVIKLNEKKVNKDKADRPQAKS